MIVPMRKLTLIMPAEDRLAAVRDLRELGVMHVESVELAENAGRTNLATRLGEIGRVLGLLEAMPAANSGGAGDETGEAVFRNAQQLFNDRARLTREQEQLQQQAAELAPWGDFSAEMLTALRRRGLRVYLCRGSAAELEAVKSAGRLCREVGTEGKDRLFVVISDQDIPAEELPLAKFSGTLTLKQLREALSARRAELAANEQELMRIRCELPLLRRYHDEIAETLDFVTVRDTLADHGRLLTLSGFVPEPELEKVLASVRAHGWGGLHRPADPKREAVPTLLDPPRWARLIEPLMKFLAISPGYDERDVSVPVLFFFTIFFGMLVGDAGYGLIFLALSGYGLYAKRAVPAARLPLALLVLLSLAAVVWGGLTGNYFGVQCKGLPWLASDPAKDQHVQLICFILALAQLALGHAMRLSGDRHWRNVAGQLGWFCILFGNFVLICKLLLYPGEYPGWLMVCYGVGVVLTAIGEIDWKDVGSIFAFPFSVVGSFVDVLSYIRLFAVGMSSFYLAACFNDMAAPLMDRALTIPLGLLVLLLGHLLNIALAAMAVLVHGVRLNTLEFSNHLGLRWAGFEFNPFRRRIKDNQNIAMER